MRIPIVVEPSATFYQTLEQIAEALEGKGDELYEAVATAVIALEERYPDDDSLPVAIHGSYGDVFAFDLGEGFLLVFQRFTERDEAKHPRLSRVRLLTIEVREPGLSDKMT